MKPKKFKDVVSSLLEMLELGQLDEDFDFEPYRYKRTATMVDEPDQLIINTLRRSAIELVEGGHYEPDDLLTDAKEVRKLFNMFIRQIKRSKLDEAMSDQDAANVQTEALARLQVVMGLISRFNTSQG